MFQQFSGQEQAHSNRRLAVSVAGSLAIYAVVGIVLVQVFALRAIEASKEKEVDVTFVKAPPATPPPAAPMPPPPPPPPVQKPRANPLKFLAPKALEAPKEVPQDQPQEADPAQERGMPEVPADQTDPAGLPGGKPQEKPVEVAAPPPKPQAVVLPAGAIPAERLNPEVKPVYPPTAREAGFEGEVIIKMIVFADGHAEIVSFIKSDPNFDDAVKAFVTRLRYKPASYDGRPLSVFVNMRIPFTLKS